VGAVQIEPLGVLLLQAATLKIEPAQAVPVAQEYPFAYYRNGQDFHLYPIQPYSEGLVYPLGKFDGGYGIAQAPARIRTTSADPPAFNPADPEARIRHQIATVILLERERLLLGEEPDPTLWPKIRDLALEYYNSVIKPTLQPSTVNCETAKAHMPTAVGWLRSINLIFGESTEPDSDPAFAAAGDEIMAALIKSMRNCYHEAATPCVDWNNPDQVSEVLGHYRALMLMAADEGEISPDDLPECTFVDVSLQGGAFHYEFEPNVWGTWGRSVYFLFEDDTVSSVGFYHPFRPKNTVLPGPTAIISITAMIDGVWQPVPFGKQFFCRDQKAERLQELMISFADVEVGNGGELAVPPQLYADNIGCWRWSGSVKSDTDYYPISGVPEFYHHTSGQITMEQDPTEAYFAYESQGKLEVNPVGYRLVSPSVVDYDDKLIHQDEEGTTCVQTLTAHITDPWAYLSPNFSGIELPNAGFGLPRELGQGSSVELIVNLPYTTQGTTCPFEGQSLDRIGLPVLGDLSANGKHIQLNETGLTGDGSGTYHVVVDLKAQRE
jgi:hypothetical protein